LIGESPLLEEGIADGIINLSALARKFQPRIEEKLKKKVSESAILMALKRLSPSLTDKIHNYKKHIKLVGDITVRSDLSEFTFVKSQTLLEKQKKLLNGLKGETNYFLTFTQGVFESTAIINSKYAPMVAKIFEGEKAVSQLSDLAAITIILSPHIVELPGVHYTILKQLAWYGINVVELVSTLTEFTIILKKSDVDLSFSILMKFL